MKKLHNLIERLDKFAGSQKMEFWVLAYAIGAILLLIAAQIGPNF